jgi:hypothetical protein
LFQVFFNNLLEVDIVPPKMNAPIANSAATMSQARWSFGRGRSHGLFTVASKMAEIGSCSSESDDIHKRRAQEAGTNEGSFGTAGDCHEAHYGDLNALQGLEQNSHDFLQTEAGRCIATDDPRLAK